MENERNKNLTSKIIHSVGLFAFTFFVSVGLLYIFNGNIILPFVVAIFLLFAIYFTVDILVKKNQYREEYIHSRDVNQESIDIYELLLLSIYSILTIITFFAFSNTIIIEIFGKEKIIANSKEKIKNVDNLMTDFSKFLTNKIEKEKNNIESEILKVKNSKNKSVEIKNNQSKIKGCPNCQSYYVDFSSNKTIEESKDKIFSMIENKKNNDDPYGKTFKVDYNTWMHERKLLDNIVTNWDHIQISNNLKNLETKFSFYSQKFKGYDSSFNSMEKPITSSFSVSNPISNLKNCSLPSNMLILLGYIVINYFILYPYISTRKFKAKIDNSESGGIKL
jgi:hypothetical protein